MMMMTHSGLHYQVRITRKIQLEPTRRRNAKNRSEMSEICQTVILIGFRTNMGFQTAIVRQMGQVGCRALSLSLHSYVGILSAPAASVPLARAGTVMTSTAVAITSAEALAEGVAKETKDCGTSTALPCATAKATIQSRHTRVV